MDDLELSANVFHEQAIQAYISSRILLSTTTLFPVGLYNAHLACECMLKSLTAQSGTQPAFEHNLLKLNATLKVVTNDDTLDEQRYLQILSWLNPYQELGRYGALSRPQNDPNRVDAGPIKVRGAVASQPSHDIKEIDFMFTFLRSKSLITNDIVSKIIKGQVVNGWNFPVSVEEAVLAQNDYIKLEEV